MRGVGGDRGELQSAGWGLGFSDSLAMVAKRKVDSAAQICRRFSTLPPSKLCKSVCKVGPQRVDRSYDQSLVSFLGSRKQRRHFASPY